MSLSYEVTNWENGKTVLKAEHLRKIEKGITDIIAENDAIYKDEDTRKSNEKQRQEEHSRKMNEVSGVVSDIQKDYDSLQKIIIDENASANLQNQINQTNSQLEQKASYFTFKEFKQNNLTDTEALQECINYICENRVVSTEMDYNGTSLGGTVIDLCGCEIVLDKTINIATGDVRYSDLTFQNGTLKASDNFTDEYMLTIGNKQHNRGLKFYNITFNCNIKCSPIFMRYTLNTVFNSCTFTNMKKALKLLEYQTHETVFTNCYFSNIKTIHDGVDPIDYALELGVDSHVSNCIFIGFKNAIYCKGGCNMINNNHFYQIYEYAIINKDGTILNNIYGNYFDGCSIYIEKEYADLNVVSNVFYLPTLSAGIISKNILKRANISNNSYMFDAEKTSRLADINCVINNNILTTETEIFNKNDVGATNANGTLTIINFIDTKNVEVSYDESVKLNQSIRVWLTPTNLSTKLKTDRLIYQNIATQNENIVNGKLPNHATKKIQITETGISGNIYITTDRTTGLKYLENSCYTTVNQGQNSNFKIAQLPTGYYPSKDMYISVVAKHPNDGTIYGNCLGLIQSTNGSINIIKKVGEFNENYIEYTFKTFYK